MAGLAIAAAACEPAIGPPASSSDAGPDATASIDAAPDAMAISDGGSDADATDAMPSADAAPDAMPGADAGPPASCASPLSLAAGVPMTAGASGTIACRPGERVAFFVVTIPPASQMVSLAGATLPAIIGDCACDAPYHESTIGYGEPLELIAVAPPGVPVGYAIEALEPHAACGGAQRVPLGAFTAYSRLDRAGARRAICGGATARPLFFRIEDASADSLRVEVVPPSPFVVGLFPSDCELVDSCDAFRSDAGAPLDLALPAGSRRYALVALTTDAREIEVRLRAD